jgi:hypothetical protein
LTPDDERPRTPAAGSAEEQGSQGADESAGDDLESLAGALPSPASSEGPPEADEELDLGALAAVGGQRASQAAAEGDARLSLGATPAPAAPAPDADVRAPAASGTPAAVAVHATQEAAAERTPAPAARARPAWLVPLLLGLGIGAGAAAAVFFATAREPQAASASPAALEPPPAPTPHAEASAAPMPVAVAAAPGAIEEAAAPAAPAPQASAAASAPAPAVAHGGPAQHAAVRSDAVARRAIEPQLPAAPAVPPASAQPPDPDPLAEGETPSADKPAAADEASAKTASSVDALLDEALSPDAQRNELARRQQLALAAQELPLTPSKEDVTQAMTVLLPAIRGCAMGQAGLATAGIVVRGDGRVAGVEISGAPFAGTASGRCMEGVIRRARFTPFRQPILRVKFPLAIQ